MSGLLTLQRNVGLRGQIESALVEEIKENLFWAGGHIYVAIYPLDDGVYADVDGRQNGSFSPDEKYFEIVYNYQNVGDDFLIDCGVLVLNEDSGDYDYVEENVQEFILEGLDISWGALEELEEQAWKEYDEIEEN